MVAKTRFDDEQSTCGGTWYTIDVGTKISKICYTGEFQRNVDSYLTATWGEKTNKLSLYNVYYGKAKVSAEQYFKRCFEIPLSSSINDIFYDNRIAVAGLEDGSVEIFKIEKGEQLQKSHSLHKVHGKTSGSKSVCILDGEVMSGSDNGSIMRIDLASASKPSVLSMNLNSVKCMAVCGSHEFVSGHGSGQIHLWDVRQINPAIEIGELPIFSKAVSPLTNTITSIDAHPAQANVIAYGTFSGSIAFIDVRQCKQPTPSLLNVSQEPISTVKFHPSFPTNCFVMSNEGLLQLDLSMGKSDGAHDSNLQNIPSEEMVGNFKANIWLTAASWNLLDINSLLSDGPKRPSTFDLSSHSCLSGSNTDSLSLLTGAHFF